MKKYIIALMALGLAFFTACSKQEAEDNTEDAIEATEEAAGNAADAVEEGAENVEDAAEDAM